MMRYMFLAAILLFVGKCAFAQVIGEHVNVVKAKVEYTVQTHYKLGGYKRGTDYSYDFSYNNGKIESVNVYTENGVSLILNKPLSYATYYIIDVKADTLLGIINSYNNLSIEELHDYMSYKHPAGNYGDYYFSRDGITVLKVYMSEAGLATSMAFHGNALELPEDVKQAWKQSPAAYQAYDEQKQKDQEEQKKIEEGKAEKYRKQTYNLSLVADQKTIDDYRSRLRRSIINYHENKIEPPYDVLRNSDICYQEFYSINDVTLLSLFDMDGEPSKIKAHCIIWEGDSSLYNALNDDIPILPAFQVEGYYVTSAYHIDSLEIHLFRGSVRVKLNSSKKKFKFLNKNVPEHLQSKLIELLEKENLYPNVIYTIDFLIGEVMGEDIVKLFKYPR